MFLEPGQWADQTGAGYANTSDPYVENPDLDESREEEGEDLDSEEEDNKYSHMSNEELAAEQKKLKAMLAALQKGLE